MNFCATRWVENKRVAEKLIEIWRNIEKIMKFWSHLPKSKQPKCKRYNFVQDAVDDQFLVAELSFFSFISGTVVGQSDKPMVQFMYF